MRIPLIRGVIKRRILANYRADPETVRKLLPPVFRPKLHEGHAIVGVCLIRLEGMRPAPLPAFVGIGSENAAHRMAVTWTGEDGREREGVYIARRDTGSLFNSFTGGRFFPGEQHKADFSVTFAAGGLGFKMQSRDGLGDIALEATKAEALPADSCFADLAAASKFFEGGATGYSVTSDPCRLDGLVLKTSHWKVSPLAVSGIRSRYFGDADRFPAGSIRFDHALLMEDVPHEWSGEKDMILAVI